MTDALQFEATPANDRVGLLRQAAHVLRRNLGLLAVVVFAVGFLSPLLKSGFYDDDVLNSCTDGIMRMTDSNLGRWLEDGIKGSMSGGRFFPLMIATVHTAFTLFPTAPAYKCYVLVLIVINLFEFYYLLRCWGVDRVVAQLGTLSFALLMQMRTGGDPILANAGAMQIEAGQLLLSMICLQKYFASERGAWLLGSLVIYASALLNYEISYTFLPVFPVMAFAHCRQWRRTLSIVRPYAIIFATLTAYTLGLRYHVERPAGHPYQPNLNPSDVALAAIKQASSAMPLSYALLSNYRHEYLSWNRLVGSWENWGIFVAGGALTLALLRSRSQGNREFQTPPLALLAATGLIVWILPGMPIAASPKYQQQVQMGDGYLPVYIQYVGMALLLVGLFEGFRRTFPRQWTMFAVGLVAANACVAMITYDTNRASIEQLDFAMQIDDRMLFEAALTAGLGDPIPEGETILATRYHVWLLDGPPHSSFFLAQHLKRKVYAVNSQPPAERRPLCLQLERIPSPTWFLSDACLGKRSGYVVLSRLDSTIDAPAEKYATRSFRVFLFGSVGEQTLDGEQLAISGRSFGKLADEHADQHSVEVCNLKPVSRGSDWAIYEGNFSHSVDVATIALGEVAPPIRLADSDL